VAEIRELAIKDLLERLGSLIRDLAGRVRSLPLEAEGNHASFVEQFAAQLREFVSSARQFEGAIRNSQAVATGEDFDAVRTEIPVIGALQALGSQERSTLAQAVKGAEEGKRLLQAILDETERVDRQLAETIKKIRHIATQLDRKPEDMGIPRCEDLIRGLKASHQLEDRLSELEQAFNDFLSENVQSLSRELEQIERQYDVAMLNEPWKALLEKLRLEINCIDGPAALEKFRIALTDLRKGLEEQRQFQRVSALTFEAASQHLAASAIVKLALGLQIRNRFNEALALQTCLQQAMPVEEADLTDFSECIDVLISAVAAAANKRAFTWPWIDAIVQQPWIRELRHADIKNVKTLRRLAMALLVQQQVHGVETERYLIYHWNAVETMKAAGCPRLASLLEEISRGRDVLFATQNPGAARDKKKADIDRMFERNDHGDYSVQVAEGGGFRKMEKDYLIPSLKALADRLEACCRQQNYNEATRLVAETDPESLYEDACRKAGLDPRRNSAFFVKRVVNKQANGYIPRLLDILKEFLKASHDTSDGHLSVPFTEDIASEIEHCESDDTCPDYSSLVHSVLADPTIRVPTVMSAREIFAWLADYKAEVIGMAHSAVNMLCSDGAVSMDGSIDQLQPRFRSLFQAMVNNVADGNYDRELVRKLEGEGCYHHAVLLAGIIPGYEEPELDGLREKDRIERERLLKEALTIERKEAVDMYEAAIERGYYPFVRRAFEALRKAEKQRREMTLDQRRLSIDRSLQRLNALRDGTDAPDFLPELQETVLTLVAVCEARLRQLRKLRLDDVGFPDADERINKAIKLLEFMVGQKTDLKEEVSGLLDLPSSIARVQIESATDVVDQQEELSMSATDRDVVQRIMDAWQRLGISSPDEESKNWSTLVKEFCARCQLYSSLTTKNPIRKLKVRAVADDEDVDDGRAHTESIGKSMGSRNTESKYPERAIPSLWTTYFKRPRNSYLSKEIGLYLISGSPSLTAHRQTIIERLRKDDSRLHIVFVPGHEDAIEQITKQMPGRTDLQVVGPRDIRPIITAKLPNVYLRKLLLKNVHPAVASPFTFEGYVDFDNDLFVGRLAELEQLKRLSRAFICGGRRIGKTSLIRALKKSLEEDESQRWKVAFCDAGDLNSNDKTDPDSVVAGRIARQLGLSAPSCLEEFRDALIEFAKHTRTAVLVDETDKLIKTSRNAHGDKAFPFFYRLRSVEQSLPQGMFKVVVAGFKELFYESRRDDVEDTAYPFRNWLHPVELQQLDYKEVESLLKAGFSEQLGIEVDSDVARSIFQRASGHPAFVQFFCQRLLLRRARLKDSAISPAEVDSVFTEGMEQGTVLTFISYVDQTLGYNLSHLDRAVVLTLAIILQEAGNHKAEVSQQEIVASLETYFKISSVSMPTDGELLWSFQYLVMVGMLIRREWDRYQIAYDAYVEILTRLEKNRVADLASAIGGYDEERKKRSANG
jgi:hypothetical protein